MDSTAALELGDVPGPLLVIGGGYIGLELGHRLRRPRIEGDGRRDAAGPAAGRGPRPGRPCSAKRVETMCEHVLLEHEGRRAARGGDGVHVTLEDEHLERPRGGLRQGARVGGPQAELRHSRARARPGSRWTRAASSRSTRSGGRPSRAIYAIGDVVGEPMLAHKASHEGRVAVEAIARRRTCVFAPQAIPAVVFTDPELAWCGLTEDAGASRRAAGRDRQVPVGRVRPRDDARPDRRPDQAGDRARAPSACSAWASSGPGAGELIAEGVLAIEMGAVVADLEADASTRTRRCRRR